MERLELKSNLAVDDKGTISGAAWLWGTPDRVGDIITKGAVSVVTDDLPMLFKHDVGQPIGLWNEVKQTDAGLEVKGRLFVQESDRAKAVRGMIQSGLVSGLSIGFRTKEASRRGSNRVISALDLVEISVVPNPSHPRARITSAKDELSALSEMLDRAIKALT